jgi:HD-like signal output (HDOD) protein
MINRIGRTDEFPAISKYLVEINQKLAANPETSNASELANVILKDYALTNKMLKLVNSAFYGLTAGKVTTVTRAVVILGYENIRLATLSLVLFEHLNNKSNAAALKEAMVGSFWLGLMARDIAKMDGLIDPEEAFVCAMMSQLGKLLMIHYMPKEYKQICDRMAKHHESETRAAKMACRVTYEDLGKAVAEQWNFPGQLGDCMEILDKDTLQNRKKPPSRMVALCSFTRELAAIIQDNEHPSKEFALQKLLKRYKGNVRISKKQLKALIQDSVLKIRRHIMALKLDIEKSRFIDSLASFYLTEETTFVLTEQPVKQQESAGASFQLSDEQDLKQTPSMRDAPEPKDIIMEGIQEISEAMLADNDINDVVVMSLEVLYRALGFQRALMFIREKKQPKMKVRFGYGDNYRHLVRNIEFAIGGNLDLFNISIKVGKDLIVTDARDPKLTHLIPRWYRQGIDAPAFLFLPVMFQNACIAAFYADRDNSGKLISSTEHHHLSMLRNQLVLAFKYQWERKQE